MVETVDFCCEFSQAPIPDGEQVHAGVVGDGLRKEAFPAAGRSDDHEVLGVRSDDPGV